MLERMGKYRIDSVLGEGAMGTVYRAFDPDIARIVALKTVRMELLGDGHLQQLSRRFQNEAQAAGRLNHANIVTVYEYGEAGGFAYIAMEFVDGIALDTLLQHRQTQPIPQVISWMCQLLLALHHAHCKGVIHRDIKPANLVITADQQLKVTDFGVAHLDNTSMTQTGSMVGTPCYMSPEQFRGASVDGRSDLFSTGVLLYQLLTGERPFSGSAAMVMHQVLSQVPVPPSRLNPALGLQCDRLIAKALAKSPDDRFASALDFLSALQALPSPPLPDSPMQDDDRTRLDLPCTPATGLDPDFLQQCEKRLTYLIGPIARILVRHALKDCMTRQALLQTLAQHIDEDAQRRAFLQPPL
ncbi:serine/threonine-protein kinase [Pseudomonas sp. NPDC089752]|uniref:serine/threonine-protein kinase n=1 Tax=Pseudomonas sp. NPDC089752 TaxID=3364472 RepID=UPI00382B58AE